MLNNSFWHLPGGIFTGYDIVGFLVQPSDMCDRRGQWIEWGYSGLTNEKPWNSSWSRLAISSWSGGVSSGGWRVKKRSKFSASRPHCGGEREREMERGRWGEDGVNMMEWGMSRKNGHQTNKEEKKERQLKHGINQSNQSQPRLWISIGPYESQWHLSNHHRLLRSQMTAQHVGAQ